MKLLKILMIMNINMVYFSFGTLIKNIKKKLIIFVSM